MSLRYRKYVCRRIECTVNCTICTCKALCTCIIHHSIYTVTSGHMSLPQPLHISIQHTSILHPSALPPQSVAPLTSTTYISSTHTHTPCTYRLTRPNYFKKHNYIRMLWHVVVLHVGTYVYLLLLKRTTHCTHSHHTTSHIRTYVRMYHTIYSGVGV